jgi:predicted aconitase
LYLTKREERMLSGEEGEAKALALRVIVKVGEAVGAERLIEIRHAHVSGASYMTIGDAGMQFILDLASMGARVSVPTTVNPVSYDVDNPEALPATRIDPKVIRAQEAIMKALKRMGITLTLTCTPYYMEEAPISGLREGDHVAWGESSAVAYANSVLGVWTNREGGPLALLAAIAGRTYYYGPHDPEWRKPVAAYRVAVNRPLDTAEAGVLGMIVAGSHAHERPPLVDAWFGGDAALKEFLAAIGTAGSLAMAYIPGITPGDPGDEIEEVVVVDEAELEGELERRAPPSRPDILYVGCPHASLQELRELARALERYGRPRGVRVVVSVSRHVLAKAAAEGLVARLKELGAEFVRDTCLIVSPFPGDRGLVVATNSYKAYHYLSRKKVKVGIARIEDMVKLAL